MKKIPENAVKNVSKSYQAFVYSTKHRQYLEWGISYSTKEECLDTVKKYIKDCLRLYRQHGERALKYYQDYKNFTDYPVKIRCITQVSYILPKTTTYAQEQLDASCLNYEEEND